MWPPVTVVEQTFQEELREPVTLHQDNIPCNQGLWLLTPREMARTFKPVSSQFPLALRNWWCGSVAAASEDEEAHLARWQAMSMQCRSCGMTLGVMEQCLLPCRTAALCQRVLRE